jgi:hypothetical protein
LGIGRGPRLGELLAAPDVNPEYDAGNTTNADWRREADEAPAAGPISVNYATVNGTAIAGQHYVAKSGTLAFGSAVPSGSTRTIAITPRGREFCGACRMDAS